MVELGTIVDKVRSKNAGPFWLTIDIFCGSSERFAHLSGALETSAVAALFGADAAALKRFDIAALDVIKFSLPRPVIQGTRSDLDMHGAQWANLLAEFEVAAP